MTTRIKHLTWMDSIPFSWSIRCSPGVSGPGAGVQVWVVGEEEEDVDIPHGIRYGIQYYFSTASMYVLLVELCRRICVRCMSENI